MADARHSVACLSSGGRAVILGMLQCLSSLHCYVMLRQRMLARTGTVVQWHQICNIAQSLQASTPHQSLPRPAGAAGRPVQPAGRRYSPAQPWAGLTQPLPGRLRWPAAPGWPPAAASQLPPAPASSVDIMMYKDVRRHIIALRTSNLEKNNTDRTRVVIFTQGLEPTTVAVGCRDQLADLMLCLTAAGACCSRACDAPDPGV